MAKRLFPAFLILTLSVLACSLPGGGTVAPDDGGGVPEVGGVTPEEGGVTPVVVEPLPAGPSITPDIGVPPLPAPTALEVVYEKGGNLWLWVEGTGTTQLTYTGQVNSPQLNATGDKVAYKNARDLWVVNTDGTDAHLVLDTATVAGLYVSPYGTAILERFQWDPLYDTLWFGLADEGEVYTTLVYDIWTVDASGTVAPHMEAAPGMGGPIVFSPDGLYYAARQANRIRLFNRDGTIQMDALAFDNVLTYSEWEYLPQVVWLPDSSGFRTVIPAHDPLADPGEKSVLWDVPIGGAPTPLLSFVAVPAFADFPVISPDGQNVAYMAPNGANTELHLLGLSIGDVIYDNYTSYQWGFVGWAPDSYQFVLWYNDIRNLVLGSPGSLAVPLTDMTFTEFVSWIDSTRILFRSDANLRMSYLGSTSTVIDTGTDGEYDFYSP